MFPETIERGFWNLWKALSELIVHCSNVFATYLLCRLLTAIRPSLVGRWAFLIATPLIQSLLLAALAPKGFWITLLAVFLPAVAAMLCLKLHPRAAAMLALINWMMHLLLSIAIGYLPAPPAFRSPAIANLLLVTGHWIGVAALAFALRKIAQSSGKRIDIQALGSFPWPMAAVFSLSAYNTWAMQAAGHSSGAPDTTSLTAGALAAIGLWLFFASYRSLAQSQENQELKFYLQTIETLTLELRQFRHNYRNILHGLSGYIENQEWNELSAYFRDVVRETEQAELHSYALALKSVTNYALFGLLSEKLTRAKQMGVEVDLAVTGIIGQVEMNATDLCQVIGIFLDNAIEAAEQVSGGKVVVSMRCDASYQQVTVSNDCARTPPLSKASSGGYSGKGFGRGSGLYYAKRLLAKYEHVLHNTSYADGEFRQELIIPVNSEALP